MSAPTSPKARRGAQKTPMKRGASEPAAHSHAGRGSSCHISWRLFLEPQNPMCLTIWLRMSGLRPAISFWRPCRPPARRRRKFLGPLFFDLVGVREENIRLKAEVEKLNARLLAQGEAIAELERLRALVDMPLDASWRPIGCRVLSGKLGPNAVLDSITISRGLCQRRKARNASNHKSWPGGQGTQGQSPCGNGASCNRPQSRVAVFGQESRAPGILKGRGMVQGHGSGFCAAQHACEKRRSSGNERPGRQISQGACLLPACRPWRLPIIPSSWLFPLLRLSIPHAS